MNRSYGIHWFRRDLRICGNPALEWSRKRHSGRVLGLFILDPQFLSRPDIGLSRFGFFLKTLAALRVELQESGGDLLVLDQGPDNSFRLLIEALRDRGRLMPESISFNRDYEPFARERDSRVEALLSDRYGITVQSERDHLLIEPQELSRKNDPGSFYQVFTPFSKRWIELLASDEIQERLAFQKRSLRKRDGAPLFDLKWKDVLSSQELTRGPLRDCEAKCQDEYQPRVDIPLPEAGFSAALSALDRFSRQGLKDYAERRDYPSLSGTSHLSPYLKNGSITVPQIIARLGLDAPDPRSKKASSRRKYLTELIWREFYYHVLYHRPQVEHSAFQSQYRKVAWENNESHFRAWCEGRTGYPIVDAAMRQLNTTGWMHNRMRMVVASFLTKDLLIHWQWGERYFMQKLLDGDLAPNNGGWQWAASTGCDPQPYFRIFNPTLQSKRFDPDGKYLRSFVPELARVETRFVHEPWKSPQPIAGYPHPIVDHAAQSRKAIQLFKTAKARSAK